MCSIKSILNDEIKCHKHFVAKRHEKTYLPSCPKCGYPIVYKNGNRLKCGDSKYCGNSFSHTTKTALENTKLPISIWYSIIYDFATKKSTSVSLSKSLNITQKTAWLLKEKVKNSSKGVTKFSSAEKRFDYILSNLIFPVVNWENII
jgi:hypothetical protein